MGQYYKAVFLKENKKTVDTYFYSWDYESGLKLMEHSWLLNPFVNAVETKLANNPTRVVWAGDYADEEKNSKSNLYDRCNDKNKHSRITDLPFVDAWNKEYCFIVNHTKKEFVNKNHVPDNDGWRIHPLPLLTCEGNGRGGGDYHGEDPIIGSWSRDVISIETESSFVLDGYKEINFQLVEA
jgi:hypothetical protein